MSLSATLTNATGGDECQQVSNAFLERAIAQADLNALRLALYQLTADPSLAAMETERLDLWGGTLFTYAIAERHQAEIRSKALKYLQDHQRSTEVTTEVPDPLQARTIMELFGHGALSDDEFRCGYEEAAFEEFPRGVSWTHKPSAELLSENNVLVIGAGVSGIAAAVQLQQLGIPYSIVERQSDLGGTWNLNDYPEARVDSSSFIYQYKFEKRYPWKEFFASGSETKRYLKHVATKFKVFDEIAFNTEVLKATWNETYSKWEITIRSAAGVESKLTATFVLNATGLFATANLPNIAGINAFKGRSFHTTSWDHAFDVKGKRVAVIGNGSTGAQVIPHLAKQAASLKIFQRTPNWVVPLEGYKAAVSSEIQWLIDYFPFYWNWFSYGLYFLNTQLEGLQSLDTEWRRAGGTVNKRNDEMRARVETLINEKLQTRPDLIGKVIPAYPPLARRLVVDNGWYDALLQDNVELITEGIDRFNESGIVTSDGRQVDLDLIVYAAGFAVTKYFWPIEYVGRNGSTLEKLWAEDGPRAYIGMTLPGFPNLFVFYGPNGQARSGSFYSMSEVWSRYAITAIVTMLENGKKSIEVKHDAYEAYNEKQDRQLNTLLWETFGKGHYYLTEKGRTVVNTPWTIVEYWSLLEKPDFNDYVMK